jgi:hypothetical protein
MAIKGFGCHLYRQIFVAPLHRHVGCCHARSIATHAANIATDVAMRGAANFYTLRRRWVVAIVRCTSYSFTSAEVIEFGGNGYLVYDSVSTWKDAAAFCNNTGGSLLYFKTDAEQDFIEKVLKKQQIKRVWTAGQYINAYWQWCRGG